MRRTFRSPTGCIFGVPEHGRWRLGMEFMLASERRGHGFERKWRSANWRGGFRR
jgi:hypothetical protein